VFYLSNCDTCRRIMTNLQLKEKNFILQDIKFEPITELQLEHLKELAGSYSALFSKTSRKYKELGLTTKNLSEDDQKELILKEYTFLKRPVILLNGKVFIGNASKTVDAVAQELLST
jgi:arsenate reductase